MAKFSKHHCNFIDNTNLALSRDIEKLIDEAGKRIVAPRFRKGATKERNQKIQQIKELMQALKRDFPNLDLSDIKIPTTQQIS